MARDQLVNQLLHDILSRVNFFLNPQRQGYSLWRGRTWMMERAGLSMKRLTEEFDHFEDTPASFLMWKRLPAFPTEFWNDTFFQPNNNMSDTLDAIHNNCRLQGCVWNWTLAGLNTTTDYALHIGATSGLKKIISSVEAASNIHLAFPCPNQQKPVKNINLTKRKEGDH